MNELITYSLVDAYYHNGDDYLDSFWPFAVRVFPVGESLVITGIKDKLNSEYSLDIPLLVLSSILHRAKRKGYLEVDRDRKYVLSALGVEYLDSLELERNVEREINALLEDMAVFFKENGHEVTGKEIHSLFIPFLNQNIKTLIEFINPDLEQNNLVIKCDTDKEKLLIEYIVIAEKRKPVEYSTIRRMVFGSVISAVLYSKDASDINNLTRRFKNCTIFLDSNIVFSLLDFHHKDFADPVKELFSIVQKNGFKIKVFDFTVEEICRYINIYKSKRAHYPSFIKINSIYSILRKNGWGNTDVDRFLMKIETIIKDLKIDIEWTGIKLDKYTPLDDKLREKLVPYKPCQSFWSQNHDIAVIEKVEKYRGRPVWNIEDSRYFFLTSDNKLSKFNLIEMNHKNKGTVNEVILDRLLANILWLKNPNSDLPMKSIIAAHSKHLFINRSIWERFFDVMFKLRREGIVTDQDISMLIYHGSIEDSLAGIDESEVDKITDALVLDVVHDASKIVKKAISVEVGERAKEIRQAFEDEYTRKESKSLDKLFQAKDRLKASSDSYVDKMVKRIKIGLLAVYLLAIFICFYCKGFGLVKDLYIAIAIVALPLAFLGISFLHVWNNIKKKWSDKRYNKRIHELGLNDE